jgi:hypothetical protein
VLCRHERPNPCLVAPCCQCTDWVGAWWAVAHTTIQRTGVDGALLSLSGNDAANRGYRRNAATSYDGKVVFPDVLPGSYFLRSTHKEFALQPQSIDITVTAGKTHEVRTWPPAHNLIACVKTCHVCLSPHASRANGLALDARHSKRQRSSRSSPARLRHERSGDCWASVSQVEITGNRTAYSAHGTVVSLNGAPEGNVAVEAIALHDTASSGVDHHHHHPEETVEAVTEMDGTYRLRGLQPGSRYDVRIKRNAFVDGASPAVVPVHMVWADRRGLDFVIFHSPSISQIAGAVATTAEWLPYLTGASVTPCGRSHALIATHLCCESQRARLLLLCALRWRSLAR